MIVISTYNPQSQRTTQDEELLTTLLISLVSHVGRLQNSILSADDDIQREYFETQKLNCNRLIGLAYPLLGLDWFEVQEMVKTEVNKWQTAHIGKKSENISTTSAEVLSELKKKLTQE